LNFPAVHAALILFLIYPAYLQRTKNSSAFFRINPNIRNSIRHFKTLFIANVMAQQLNRPSPAISFRIRIAAGFAYIADFGVPRYLFAVFYRTFTLTLIMRIYPRISPEKSENSARLQRQPPWLSLYLL
jgi:hypothetical protein